MAGKDEANGQRHPVETDTSISNGHDHSVPANDTTATIADTGESPERIAFDDAVAEGKAILAKIEDAQRGQLRLGELAHKVVHPTYGDRTIAKFAKELGIAPCTLKRYRDVYRAWEGKISAPGRQSYAVLRELAALEDREQIIRDNPVLTKQQAQNMRRKRESKEEGKTQEAAKLTEVDEWHKHNKRWFAKTIAHANDFHRAADFLSECTTDDQWLRLLKAIEQGQLMYIRGGGVRMSDLADLLDWLLEKSVSENFAERVAQWQQARQRERQRGAVHRELKERGRREKASREVTQETVAPAGVIVPTVPEATTVQAMGA
jgi:hypothetical protein